MDIKKLAPWNWFKKEEDESGAVSPVRRSNAGSVFLQRGEMNPMVQLHREMDRLFDNAFRSFGLSPLGRERYQLPADSGMLKPRVDIGASEDEYTISMEVPGVNEKDVKVEIVDGTMIIRGEKKQETEEKDTDYYRVERSYGAFQRVLCLPEDASQDEIKATFKNGVLHIRVPRKALPKADVKQIEINSN